MDTINGFPWGKRSLGAFDVIGFTKVVKSGGELYDAMRADGRWDALKAMSRADQRLYGIASFDRECGKDEYRYTIGIARDEGVSEDPALAGLYPFHIKASDWVVFSLDFEADYKRLWQSDPYQMIGGLGFRFNNALGLHIDVYGPEFDGHAMEFWMPVKNERSRP